MSNKYQDLAAYPDQIREMELAVLDAHIELEDLKTSLELHEARLTFSNYNNFVTKPSDSRGRKAEIRVLLDENSEYRGMLLKKRELEKKLGRLNLDLGYLKHQFSVVKIQEKQKIHGD